MDKYLDLILGIISLIKQWFRGLNKKLVKPNFFKESYRSMKLAMLVLKNHNTDKTFFSIMYDSKDSIVDSMSFYMIHNTTVEEISKEFFYTQILSYVENFALERNFRFYVMKDGFQDTFNKLYDFSKKYYSEYKDKLYVPVNDISTASLLNRNEFLNKTIGEFITTFPDISPTFVITFWRSLTINGV